MKKLTLERPMPTINGFPVPIYELDLPKSREEFPDVNNHHMCYTARMMGRTLLTSIWRNMDENQIILPRDVHQILHDRYAPPKDLPSLTDLVDYLDESYDRGKLMRLGTAFNPSYEPITKELRSMYLEEYGRLK